MTEAIPLGICKPSLLFRFNLSISRSALNRASPRHQARDLSLSAKGLDYIRSTGVVQCSAEVSSARAVSSSLDMRSIFKCSTLELDCRLSLSVLRYRSSFDCGF